MAVFPVQIVSSYGRNLLASATATNRIVYIGALSSSSLPDNPEDSSQYLGESGTIESTTSSENSARIVAKFQLTSSYSVKVVAILARLENQSVEDSIVFAYAYDPTSTISLPSSSVVRFAFNIKFNTPTPTAEVVIEESGSVNLSELNRFMSCYSPGNPSAGEDQIIYGDKTFKNIVYIEELEVTNVMSVESLGANSGTLTITSDVDVPVINITSFATVKDLFPLEGSESGCSIGSENKRFEEVYCLSLHSIGVVTNVVNTYELTTWDNSPLQVNVSLVPKRGVELLTLGSETNVWEAVYAKKLYGAIQYPKEESGGVTGTVSVPVGAIVCIIADFKIGEEFTIGGSVSYNTCSLDGTPDYHSIISEGTYVALTTNNETGKHLLALRIK